MEESYFEEGEGTHGPVFDPETPVPGRRNYGNYLAYQNAQPKRELSPEPKQPTLRDHYNWMDEARERYEAAVTSSEARNQKAILFQQELSKLADQQRELAVQKASAIESGDKKKLTDLNQDIEIIQYQIEKIKTQMTALQDGEDARDLLKKMRETERQFYAMVLEHYKTQVTSGTCDLPFSMLLRRAYALGSRVGIGRVRDFLFQWVGEPSLAESHVESIIQEIEAEYGK